MGWPFSSFSSLFFLYFLKRYLFIYITIYKTFKKLSVNTFLLLLLFLIHSFFLYLFFKRDFFYYIILARSCSKSNRPAVFLYTSSYYSSLSSFLSVPIFYFYFILFFISYIRNSIFIYITIYKMMMKCHRLTHLFPII